MPVDDARYEHVEVAIRNAFAVARRQVDALAIRIDLAGIELAAKLIISYAVDLTLVSLPALNGVLMGGVIAIGTFRRFSRGDVTPSLSFVVLRIFYWTLCSASRSSLAASVAASRSWCIVPTTVS